MGTCYTLVNFTMRERLRCERVGSSKQMEILGNPVATAMIALYMIQHTGDAISLVGDDSWTDGYIEAIGRKWCAEEVFRWPDCFEAVASEGVRLGVFSDHGIVWQDDDDPQIYTRDIRLTTHD
jgi:hypothetical protein